MTLLDLLAREFAARPVLLDGLKKLPYWAAFVQNMDGSVQMITKNVNPMTMTPVSTYLDVMLVLKDGSWSLNRTFVGKDYDFKICDPSETVDILVQNSGAVPSPQQGLATITLRQAEDFECSVVRQHEVIGVAHSLLAEGNGPGYLEDVEKLAPETEVAPESPEVPDRPEVPERKPARRIGKSPALSAPYGLSGSAVGEDKHLAVRTVEVPEGYADLLEVLIGAFEQASAGKGKERHASNLPFIEQPMQTLSDALQDDAGMAFQAMKKIRESRGLSLDAAIRELHGAINYAAGMVLWRQKRGK